MTKDNIRVSQLVTKYEASLSISADKSSPSSPHVRVADVTNCVRCNNDSYKNWHCSKPFVFFFMGHIRANALSFNRQTFQSHMSSQSWLLLPKAVFPCGPLCLVCLFLWAEGILQQELCCDRVRPAFLCGSCCHPILRHCSRNLGNVDQLAFRMQPCLFFPPTGACFSLATPETFLLSRVIASAVVSQSIQVVEEMKTYF